MKLEHVEKQEVMEWLQESCKNERFINFTAYCGEAGDADVVHAKIKEVTDEYFVVIDDRFQHGEARFTYEEVIEFDSMTLPECYRCGTVMSCHDSLDKEGEYCNGCYSILGIEKDGIVQEYVNVYLEDRAYGGPEEGGWYYTCGEPVLSVPVLAGESAEPIRKQLLEHYSNEDRPSMSSVLSEGEYRIRVQRHTAEPYPHVIPHYE